MKRRFPVLSIAWAFALLTFFVVKPANAQTANPLSSSKTSARGLMRTATTDVVLGQQFDVTVTVPASTSEEDSLSLGIRWYRADKPGQTWAEKEKEENNIGWTREVEIPEKPPVAKVVKVYTPFERPGRHELRLFRCPHYCTTLIDVLPVNVGVGRVPDALELDKTIFRPGEPIELKITLPLNRYYYGNWNGPSLQLVPTGRTREEEAAWLQRCASCYTWLAGLVHGDEELPWDLGGGKATRPGKHAITMKEVQARLIPHLLEAPKDPGQYEIRLYDRGFAYELEDYWDLYFASQKIVVEPFGSAAKVAEIKFVRKTDQGFEAIPDKTLMGGGLIAVEVTMNADTTPDDTQRSGKIAWGNGPNDERQLDVYRVSARTFRSEVFRIEIAPSATTALPSAAPATKRSATEASP